MLPLIDSLQHHRAFLSRHVLRQLQPYRIGVSHRQYNTLLAAGWVEKIVLDPGTQRELCILDLDGYDAALGVRWDNPYADAPLIS